MLSDARVLILDEATSNVDSRTGSFAALHRAAYEKQNLHSDCSPPVHRAQRRYGDSVRRTDRAARNMTPACGGSGFITTFLCAV